jgi:hypothetical protein
MVTFKKTIDSLLMSFMKFSQKVHHLSSMRLSLFSYDTGKVCARCVSGMLTDEHKQKK